MDRWGVRGSRPWTPCADGENPEAAAPWIADVGGNPQFGLPWWRRGVSLGSGWVNIPSWKVLCSVYVLATGGNPINWTETPPRVDTQKKETGIPYRLQLDLFVSSFSYENANTNIVHSIYQILI